MKYLGAILVLCLMAGSANAKGIWGCDRAVAYDYCSGSVMKDSVKKALALGLLKVMKAGYCGNKKVDLNTPVEDCMTWKWNAISYEQLNQAMDSVLQDKSVTCPVGLGNYYAYATETLANDFWGNGRGVKAREVISTMYRSGDQSCANHVLADAEEKAYLKSHKR